MVVPLALPRRHVGHHRAGVRGNGCSVSLADVILGESQARAASPSSEDPSSRLPAPSRLPRLSFGRKWRARAASGARLRGAPSPLCEALDGKRRGGCRLLVPKAAPQRRLLAARPVPGVWCSGWRVEEHRALVRRPPASSLTAFLSADVRWRSAPVAGAAKRGESPLIGASEAGSCGVSVTCRIPGTLWR